MTKMNLTFTPSIEIHARWNIDLNFRAKIIKLLEENKKKKIELELGKLKKKKKFDPKKKKIQKLDFVKLRTFVHQKRPLRKWKDKWKAGKKYLQLIYLIKDLYPGIYSNNSVLRQKTHF